MPSSREDVWKQNNGAPNGMDKHDIFLPENFNYRVVSIVLFENNGLF